MLQIQGILLQHLKLNWPIRPLQIVYSTYKMKQIIACSRFIKPFAKDPRTCGSEEDGTEPEKAVADLGPDTDIRILSSSRFYTSNKMMFRGFLTLFLRIFYGSSWVNIDQIVHRILICYSYSSF